MSGEAPARQVKSGTEAGTPPLRPGWPSLRSGVAYAAYHTVTVLAAAAGIPCLPLLLLTRHGRALGERLGRVPSAVRTLCHPVWIHAASVGEVLAAAALVDEIRQRWPDCHILISTTSVTGRETAQARAGADAVMLLPVDIRFVIDHAMRAIQPRCLVLIETEIWPALIRAAAARRIPCVMVSGRISERAARRYAWVRWLTRAVLAQVSGFAMQTDADAARIVALGAPAARVQVVGSLKYARANVSDVSTARAAAEAQTLLGARPVLIAASTHEGEEELVLAACAPLWRTYADMLLVVAPRRPERFDQVEALLGRVGVAWARRSRLAGPVDRSIQVLLLDTMGELPNLLPAARGVFVGGTIVPVGGHNVLEPALFGKPVAFGPFTGNVAAAADALLEHAAGVRIRTAAELQDAWDVVLRRPEVAAEIGARGRALVVARAAVAERTFEVVRQCVGA